MKQIQGLYHTTGAFAALAGLNKRTLHYYDEIGLFCPNHMGENGYRYYSANQLDRLSLIVTLRDLGVSLEEIRTCLNSHDPEAMNRLLGQQRAEIDQRILALEKQKQLLAHILTTNLEFQQGLQQGYCIRTMEAQGWEVLEQLAPTQGKQEHNIANYLTDGPYIALYLHTPTQPVLIQRREGGGLHLPRGEYLCRYLSVAEGQGQLPRLQQQAEDMAAWAAQQGLALAPGILVEYNDYLAGQGKGTQYFCLRAKISARKGS